MPKKGKISKQSKNRARHETDGNGLFPSLNGPPDLNECSDTLDNSSDKTADENCLPSMPIETLKISGNCQKLSNTSRAGNKAIDRCGSSNPANINKETLKNTSWDSKWAPRPNFGKAGRPIVLVSNYFSLSCNTGTIFHYHVEINSVTLMKKYGKNIPRQTAAEAAEANVPKIKHQLDRFVGRLKCREVFDELIKIKALRDHNPVYDGWRNIFTSKPLPIVSKQIFNVNLEVFGKIRTYEVSLQPVKKANGTNIVDIKSLEQNYDDQNELIMAYSSIMNHRDPPCTQINLGRSFFFLNSGDKKNLGEGLEVWFGYNQSIHWTQKGPSLVINLAAKAFHKSGPVINYIKDLISKDITRFPGLKLYEFKKIEEALKGVKVFVTHLKYKRKYTIDGISKESARDLKLKHDDRNISVADYFEIKYGPLKYPHLPCLNMRAANNKTFIPIENCVIVEGQPLMGRMAAHLNAKMIQQTAIAPKERFRAIDQSAKHVQAESGSKMKSYEIVMDLEPRKVKGRVIEPPSLGYIEGPVCRPDEKGYWRLDKRHLYRASVDIKSWVMFCFADFGTVSVLENVASIIIKTSKKLGLNFGQFLGIKPYSKQDTSEKMLRYAEHIQASFALIILSRKDMSHNYDEIKFIADYKLGFVTQCMDSNVLERFNEQIATNLCLKINTKFGGINHILFNKPKVLTKPVMILGADVVHSPRGSGCPSIAAVVGSLDAFPFKYKVACKVQDNPDGKLSQEVILDIRDMVKSLLTAFYHNTKGKYPEKIIFYRDGVSEGQFEAVRDQEVHEVQMASQEVIGVVVPITFIIVQKRHQTRFRPVDSRDGIGKAGNVPAGTTVDTDVTHPNHFDFFLNSHEGIQGTSKPAHYTVLHDDNKFDADELQSLSYHLCYTYGKCNRSISIPTPVMYADLACYRAKKYADFHLQAEQVPTECDLQSKVFSISRLPDYARQAINTMGDFKNNMFFV